MFNLPPNTCHFVVVFQIAVKPPSLSGSRHHIAYLRDHSFAISSYFFLSDLYILAISGTSGSSGLGSVSSEQMDSNTLEIVSAGDH